MRYMAEELEQRTAIAFEEVFPAGHVDRMHCHGHAQLGFSLSGIISVRTETASYILPPHRAIWIPEHTAHETACRGEVRFQAVYFDAGNNDLPGHCKVFEATPLLRGLIHELVGLDTASGPNSREARLVDVLLAEIPRMLDRNVGVIMPDDLRLQRVCSSIIAAPGDRRNTSQWAKLAGMGQRTFIRHFKKQTGMGFALWRQQVRLMEAVSRLQAGEPVTSVAFEVGYDSPSAFASMFHRTVGLSPSDYRKLDNVGA